ncbi:hypothetical protein [Streptomyces xanthochromogenes]
MTMTLVPHTQKLLTSIKLDTLPAPVQDQFDEIWKAAEQAADHRELTAYAALHAQAARLIGLRLPATGELARCTCPACYCTRIFDAAHARTHLDGTVEFVQCEHCADIHLLTGDE